jgi:hypothetical protein
VFAIHYVATRESDQAIHKQITETPSLDNAIAIARTRIRNTNIAIGPLQPIGFLIYDASGSQLFHREYPAMK